MTWGSPHVTPLGHGPVPDHEKSSKIVVTHILCLRHKGSYVYITKVPKGLGRSENVPTCVWQVLELFYIEFEEKKEYIYIYIYDCISNLTQFVDAKLNTLEFALFFCFLGGVPLDTLKPGGSILNDVGRRFLL